MLGTTSFSQVSSEERWSLSFRHSEGGGEFHRTAGQEASIKNNYYGDLCFGVFALSVEIRPSAAGGTCVS